MDDRERNGINRECREEEELLIMRAACFDKNPNEKPGQFLSRVKGMLAHLPDLRADHFYCHPDKIKKII